jgi:hypothetical protein
MAPETIPTLGSRPTLPIAQVNDIEKVGVEAANRISEPKKEQRIEYFQVSQYAKHGLNNRPLTFVGWKDPSPGLTVHIPIYTERLPRLHETYQANGMQGDDELMELQEMMVPDTLRQGNHDGDALPIDLQAVVQEARMSKYSTGFVTSSGWHPKNNSNWKILSRKPTKTKIVSSTRMDNAAFDDTVQNLSKDAATPLVDERYFDLDEYLEYVKRSAG